MTPAEFIPKWQASTRNERAACQEQCIDLCRLLHEPTPNSDPTGEDYAFKMRATKFTGADGWLNPPDLVERVPEVVPGFPDRIIPRNAKAAAVLKTRTLTNLYNARGTPDGVWLDNLHRALDAAVAVAYGWPADLSDDDILGRLLELNRIRSAGVDGRARPGHDDKAAGHDDTAAGVRNKVSGHGDRVSGRGDMP